MSLKRHYRKTLLILFLLGCASVVCWIALSAIYSNAANRRIMYALYVIDNVHPIEDKLNRREVALLEDARAIYTPQQLQGLSDERMCEIAMEGLRASVGTWRKSIHHPSAVAEAIAEWDSPLCARSLIEILKSSNDVHLLYEAAWALQCMSYLPQIELWQRLAMKNIHESNGIDVSRIAIQALSKYEHDKAIEVLNGLLDSSRLSRNHPEAISVYSTIATPIEGESLARFLSSNDRQILCATIQAIQRLKLTSKYFWEVALVLKTAALRSSDLRYGLQLPIEVAQAVLDTGSPYSIPVLYVAWELARKYEWQDCGLISELLDSRLPDNLSLDMLENWQVWWRENSLYLYLDAVDGVFKVDSKAKERGVGIDPLSRNSLNDNELKKREADENRLKEFMQAVESTQ